ncbi:MAG: hypothetical protein COW30_01235 [Rhodospirillales bacterium CG15_BIG_FIL_POST_REV_8_21_14_020_66_15]|nr:MAG: hypothetical protein COW30_01235 [Rhodospirillales bacterium CG15_BIG_FIL_POST_REV_8_21_14_020_66_15]
MPTEPRSDTGGAVVSAILIGVACLVIWDSMSYMDKDSAVFPRTFAGVLIVASAAYIVKWLLGRGEAGPGADTGSLPRRVLLVGIMLGGTMAMPWIGFIGAALPVFAALTLVAMYDPWTRFRVLVYPLIGIAIVLGFFYLFREVLQVPLPTGDLFDS